jgi:hypothetical protein
MWEASEGPSTPWISFKVLFRLIQDKISFIARELLFHHDKELKVLSIQQVVLCPLVLIMIVMLGTGIFIFLFNKKEK